MTAALEEAAALMERAARILADVAHNFHAQAEHAEGRLLLWPQDDSDERSALVQAESDVRMDAVTLDQFTKMLWSMHDTCRSMVQEPAA